MNKATLYDVLILDAIEASFKIELRQLREFYEAATALNIILAAGHPPSCRSWRAGRLDLCDCGAAERQARIDKALAALAEAACDDDEPQEGASK